MMASKRVILAGVGLAALAAGAAAWGQPRGGTGPAVYWMSADTASGLAGMAGGMGQGRPSAGTVMGAMLGGRGGRSSYVHNLPLQLGSPRRATGAPSAEHVPPAGLQAGQVLPLL